MTIETRMETDSMGPIEVPADRYWGAQTARSLVHFPIGDDRMPEPVIRAMGILKEASAQVNADLGKLAPDKSALDCRRRSRGFRRKAQPSFSFERLADGKRNPEQHECQ